MTIAFQLVVFALIATSLILPTNEWPKLSKTFRGTILVTGI